MRNELGHELEQVESLRCGRGQCAINCITQCSDAVVGLLMSHLHITFVLTFCWMIALSGSRTFSTLATITAFCIVDLAEDIPMLLLHVSDYCDAFSPLLWHLLVWKTWHCSSHQCSSICLFAAKMSWKILNRRYAVTLMTGPLYRMIVLLAQMESPVAPQSFKIGVDQLANLLEPLRNKGSTHYSNCFEQNSKLII